MKPLILCLSMVSVFPASSKAEDPVMLGIRGALNVFAPIPPETSHTVRTTAAEMLARYVKQHNGSLLSKRKSGSGHVWMEMRGLQLTRVTTNAVSQADQANGTLESYMVSVDCEMYRNYDAAASKWSNWHNGRNPFMPPVIHVERQTNGQWIARISTSTILIAQHSRGNPNIIPHGSQPALQPALALTAAPQPAPAVVKAPAVPGTEKTTNPNA